MSYTIKLNIMIKKLNSFLHLVMLRFHSHEWEYEQDNWQTIRTCKKCGVKHVNKHIVSQIYGSEHWYDYNEA